MSFSDHKITAFTHRIADLPDQPNLPADELKERFDSSPEELRESVNGICDDADRLEERVSGIIAETFGDSIDKSMLSDELQDELDAKATQTALSAAVDTLEAANAAETAAREEADGALSTRLTTVEDSLPEKCEIFTGTYTGNWSGSGGGPYTQTTSLGFQPKAVLLLTEWGAMTYYRSSLIYAGGFALRDLPARTINGTIYLTVTSSGFSLNTASDYEADVILTNYNGYTYYYIIFS